MQLSIKIPLDQGQPDLTSPTMSIASPVSASTPTIQHLLRQYPVNITKYEQFREYLHKNPELSTMEQRTASFIAFNLSLLGAYEVRDKIGGYGVVGVFKNGHGPKILLRAALDGLPIKEQTGLPYASQTEMLDYRGSMEPVMHASGHDIEMICLLGTAERLVSMRDQWNGTVIIVFQPDKELFGGARSMVDDGLYTIVPKPEIVLSQHIGSQKAGHLGMIPGPQFMGGDTLKITVNGRGGHAGMPHLLVDPTIMMASCILRLQTIVSREVNSSKETAIVTVSQVSAGSIPTVIADTASFYIHVKTAGSGTRERVLASVIRIINAECQASGASTAPIIERLGFCPATCNNTDVTESLYATFSEVFGDHFRPHEFPRRADSDDLSILVDEIKAQSCCWIIGGTDPKSFDDRDPRRIPSSHSARFAPPMQPTIQVGIDAMTAATLTYLR